MTTPSRTQLAKLRQVGLTAEALQKAAAAHHEAMRAAVKAGCTDSMLAIELDVSRQAVHQYRHRWLTVPMTRAAAKNRRQGTLFPSAVD